MSTGRLAIAVLVLSLAIGGGIVALADTHDDRSIGVIELDDGTLRKNDSADEVGGIDEDDDDRARGDDGTGDGDGTNGNDGTGGGHNTGDGDETNGNDGTGGGHNTGDGDGTNGNDGTGGGHNTGDVTYDAPAGTATGGGDTT